MKQTELIAVFVKGKNVAGEDAPYFQKIFKRRIARKHK